MSEPVLSSVTYEYTLLIRHPQADRFLLLPQGEGWVLPWFRRKERRFWQEVAHINQAVVKRLGLRAITLRCLDTAYDAELDRVRSLYMLESQDPTWVLPPGGRWADPMDLSEHLTAHPQADLAEVLFPFPGTELPGRPPWYAPGWFAQAEAWLTLAVARVGRTLTGPVLQMRSWPRACLLQAETNAGPVYLKAAPAHLAHEAAVTHALAARYPQHIPPVLARHPQAPWFLMAGVAGVSLALRQDLAAWENTLRTFALIQIDLVGRADRLVELGCPLHPVDSLAAQMERLLNDLARFRSDRPASLTPQDLAALRAKLPRLQAQAQRLAQFKLPLTLEHGDFWPGQVLIVEDTPEPLPANGARSAAWRPAGAGSHPVFIDWSDAAIAHPFFSLAVFDDILEMEGYLPDVPDLRQRLRTAYLGPWTVYAPLARLVEAFELAAPLAAIHNALIHQPADLPAPGPGWEAHDLAAFFLKKLLRRDDRAVA